EFLLARPAERAALRVHLGTIHDLERLLARCSLGTATARDLVALRDSLAVLPEIAAASLSLTAPPLARLLAALDAPPPPPPGAAAGALGADAPARHSEGGGADSRRCLPGARRAAIDAARQPGDTRLDRDARARAHRNRLSQGPLQQGVRLLHRDQQRAPQGGA